NSSFWYRNDLRDGAKEFVVVDAEHGTRQPAFDHKRLAEGLSKAAGKEFNADKLPFSEIEFVENGRAVQFEVSDKAWRCDLSSYDCKTVAGSDSKPAKTTAQSGTKSDQGSESPFVEEDSPRADADTASQTQERGSRRRGGEQGRSRRSPDEKW